MKCSHFDIFVMAINSNLGNINKTLNIDKKVDKVDIKSQLLFS